MKMNMYMYMNIEHSHGGNIRHSYILPFLRKHIYHYKSDLQTWLT